MNLADGAQKVGGGLTLLESLSNDDGDSNENITKQ